MPKRIPRVTVESARAVWTVFRKYSEAVLLIMLCVVLVLAIWGWQKAANAQNRVNKLEVARAAEEAAQKQARVTAEVTGCFSSARTRPPLVRLLRNINSTEPNIPQRRKVNLLITEIARAPVTGITGKPTRKKCVALAKKQNVDYRRYDFDPRTGKLLHPAGPQ